MVEQESTKQVVTEESRKYTVSDLWNPKVRYFRTPSVPDIVPSTLKAIAEYNPIPPLSEDERTLLVYGTLWRADPRNVAVIAKQIGRKREAVEASIFTSLREHEQHYYALEQLSMKFQKEKKGNPVLPEPVATIEEVHADAEEIMQIIKQELPRLLKAKYLPLAHLLLEGLDKFSIIERLNKTSETIDSYTSIIRSTIEEHILKDSYVRLHHLTAKKIIHQQGEDGLFLLLGNYYKKGSPDEIYQESGFCVIEEVTPEHKLLSKTFTSKEVSAIRKSYPSLVDKHVQTNRLYITPVNENIFRSLYHPTDI